MYLKPASVANRVYLSLPIYGISLVRLHFHSASAQTGEEGSSWHPLPQLPLAGGPAPQTLPWGAAKGLGTATPLLSRVAANRFLAHASRRRNKTRGLGGWHSVTHPLGMPGRAQQP